MLYEVCCSSLVSECVTITDKSDDTGPGYMTARTGRMSRSSLSHNKTTGLYNVTVQF